MMSGAAHLRDRTSYFRWWVCALLFFATTINYIDRQVIGLLKGPLTEQFHWTEVDFATIVMWFQALYAAGYLFAGRFVDVVGVRLGYMVSVGLWSLAAMAHALVSSVSGFCAARACLGLAEGGNFPAAVKTVSEWFPKKERALATGIFNAGSNLGPVLTPLIVPWLALNFGWRSAFLLTGGIGFLWIVWWALAYRRPTEHKGVSADELATIQSDAPDPVRRASWGRLACYRATWAFIVGTLLTSPIWWFYLYWAPDFFSKRFGLDMKTIGPPLIVVYVLADVGSVGGGWLSSALIKKGWDVGAGRKAALLTCALCVAPVFFAQYVGNEWAAVGLFGLAAAAHQGWSCNLYTLVSDTMPRYAVSSVVGMGGFAGSSAAIFFSFFVGQVLQRTHQYGPILVVAPLAYIVGYLVIHILLPRFEQVHIPEVE